MVYGRTPFQHITNQAMKLQCIMDENYAIEFPSIDNQQLLDVLKVITIAFSNNMIGKILSKLVKIQSLFAHQHTFNILI
jgi:hypothetical protein